MELGRKRRFATAIPVFSRRKGGAERYLVNLAKGLTDEGYEVHIFAERWEDEIEGVCYHRVRTIPWPRSLRLLSFAYRATREIRKGGYDITLGVGNTLEAHVLQPHGGVHWAWFWRSLEAYDRPMERMFKLCGRWISPKQWVSGWIEGVPYRRKSLKRVVAISEMVKEDMLRWYRLPEEAISVVYNGVDTERFHPRNKKWRDEVRKRHGLGNAFALLFVSNNFRMKGLRFLIRAMAKLKERSPRSVRLLVLGRDRSLPYRRLAEGLGLGEEIVFAGSTTEMEKYYGASDLLVHPTFYDACSLTVLEALASGLPVVTTSRNGASGVLEQGRDGWVLEDPSDVGALCRAIEYFLDGKHYEPACKKAREKAEAFSEAVHFSRMKEILDRVIERR